jgi:hypothetical protein
MNMDVASYFSLQPEGLPGTVDLRGLEPPEPMEIILKACAHFGAGDCYLAHLPHVPFPLFPILEKRGLRWQVHENADGSALLLIRGKACKPVA